MTCDEFAAQPNTQTNKQTESTLVIDATKQVIVSAGEIRSESVYHYTSQSVYQVPLVIRAMRYFSRSNR